MRSRVERAQENALAEGEVVGMEQTAAAVGQHAGAEQLQQALPDVAAEVVVLHADVQLDLQRHVMGIVELQIVPAMR